ncbi:hypothetical protein OAA40_00050 [bacterium]|nr:hypothetical protein [bacterium]
MNFKLVTSLNKRLFEHKAQQLINSSLDLKYPLDIYHENSYENVNLLFPFNVNSIDLWKLPQYSFWIKNFINSTDCPWNQPDLHEGRVKKAQAKFWFRKVLSITHAVLNSNTDYVIWCDGDAYFQKPLDNKFWDFVSKYDVSCIYRDLPHIESGFVVYKVTPSTKRLMREYMGYYTTGEVWKYPRWCDGSVLTYLLEGKDIGKFKNIDYKNNDSSDFDISDYFNHIKDPFKEVRDKEN